MTKSGMTRMCYSATLQRSKQYPESNHKTRAVLHAKSDFPPQLEPRHRTVIISIHLFDFLHSTIKIMTRRSP